MLKKAELWISLLMDFQNKHQSHKKSIDISIFLISSHICPGLSSKNKVGYLSRNIQVNHKVFARGRSEEKVEVAPCQPQRLIAVFGYQDIAVGRNRTPDLEH